MNTDIPSPAMQVLLLERTLAPVPDVAPPPPTERYLRHARSEARRAAVLRTLNTTAQNLGFKAMPLPDYLSWLAQKSQVTLSQALPSGKTGMMCAFATLAREIGLSMERIGLLARAFVALRVEGGIQVERDDEVPFVEREFLNGRDMLHAGIVDEDVDAAERVDRGLGHRRGGVGVGDVDAHADRVAALVS